MAVPTTITDLSVTAASNSPAGADSVGSGTGPDDYLRAVSALLRREQAQGANVASASTVDLGAIADGNYVHITGTTTITGFGTVAAGIERTVVFDGALTLTHNATSLILPSGGNITTAAGHAAVFRSEGAGNWRCVFYSKVEAVIHAATSKTTPVGADEIGIWDSVSGLLNKVSFTNLWANLSTLYMALVAPGTSGNVLTSNGSAWTSATPAAAAVVGGSHKNLAIVNHATNPAYQLTITSDEIVAKDVSGNSQLLSSCSFTLDITVAGANGLDTGAEASSTWYHVWAISKSDGTKAALLSTSSTAPTMPTGYTYKALIGAIYNDVSSNFVRISQLDKRVDYTVALTIIDGALTTGAWTSVAVGAFFPPTAKRLKIATAGSTRFGFSPRSDGQAGAYRGNASEGVSNTMGGVFPTSRDGVGTYEVTYAATMYYWSSSATGTILSIGWEF